MTLTTGPWRRGASCWLGAAVQWAPLMVLGVGCAKAPEERCTTVGRAGGLIYSVDNILSIALQSEALDDDTEFCVVESKNAPDIYGNAYRVFPNPKLHFAAAISYRFALPEDLSEINIGRVDAEDYAANAGEFVSLPGCRIEEGARQVTCVDDEIAKFYGLLDDFDGPVTDSIGGTSGVDPSVGPTTNPTDPTTMTATDPVTATQDTQDTGAETGDDTGTPIVYPEVCNDLPPGPFDPIEVGLVFAPIVPPPGGSQDITSDGLGGFIGRSGNGLARLDVMGAAYGVANDPGFLIQAIATPVTFDYPSLGVRYQSNGDLILMQGPEGIVEVMHSPHDGAAPDVLDELVDGLGFANAVYVDPDDIVWYSDFSTGDVVRLDTASGNDSLVANVEEVNGLVYDPLRSMLFIVTRGSDGASLLYRQPVSATGTPIGDPAEVAEIDGYADGLALDECGNVYVVDQGNGADGRVDRVYMNDAGEVDDVEEIVQGLNADISNARFGYGADYGPFQTSMFLVGVEGRVFYIDVGVGGTPMPVLAVPPRVVPDDGTTGG